VNAFNLVLFSFSFLDHHLNLERGWETQKLREKRKGEKGKWLGKEKGERWKELKGHIAPYIAN